ncbi:MAG: hypothetical protein NXH86_02585 [Flavobacteriaceae bacterium]|uniref:hypothetical protein n=1 Tax=Flagellimonas TaxID=444459 RepID=UPI0025FD93D5|nr:hypothetical protein [Allomuricauda sp.]MCR9263012.1 hypothetical protein [Flavobacteriaceae bacterium]
MSDILENNTYQIQELLVRMERNNKLIQRLAQKLGSYTCEPHDYSCFEKLYELKRSFKEYTNDQKRIMDSLKQKKGQSTEDLDGEIEHHFAHFKQLEKDIAAYLLDTDKYS